MGIQKHLQPQKFTIKIHAKVKNSPCIYSKGIVGYKGTAIRLVKNLCQY